MNETKTIMVHRKVLRSHGQSNYDGNGSMSRFKLASALTFTVACLRKILYRCNVFSCMLPWSTENDFAGHMYPAAAICSPLLVNEMVINNIWQKSSAKLLKGGALTASLKKLGPQQVCLPRYPPSLIFLEKFFSPRCQYFAKFSISN